MRLTDVRWIAGLFGLVVLAACTANPPSAARPSASATGSAATCRIPYATFQLTGFIRYPDGTFTTDAGAATQPVASRPGVVRTVVLPALYGVAGSGQVTYDWKLLRWLPVPRDLVFPDGSRYAYSELIPNPASQGIGGPPPLGTLVHVVDIASGQDNVVFRSADILVALAVRPEGIYVTQPTPLADTAVPFYLWLVDPSAGTARKLLGGKVVGPGEVSFSEGTMWIMASDGNNRNGPPRLLRVSLNDGSEQAWFEPTAGFADLLGLDGAGRPVVSTFSGANGDVGKTWVLTAPGAQRAIAAQGFTGTAIADERGLLLSGDGVYLYPAGGPIKKVSAQTGGWLLGTCG
jgi:hypothetical protein